MCLAAHVRKFARWTPGSVKLLLPPRQSRGASHVGLALQATLAIVDQVIPIEKLEVLRAAEIVQNPAMLSARDAIHLAVMERHCIRSILSFDAGFDRWTGIERIHRV